MLNGLKTQFGFRKTKRSDQECQTQPYLQQS